MKGLTVADFDGNGIADIASGDYRGDVSLDGRGGFHPNGGLFHLTDAIAFGCFDDRPGTDVLIWQGNFWALTSYYVRDPQRQSRQDMR